MGPTQREQVVEFAREKGVLRSRDVDALGIPRAVLARLVEAGELVRGERGVYTLPDHPISEHHTLVEVAIKVPGAVVNLLSALAFHGLTDELPHAVWIAIRSDRHAPRMESVSLEITWSMPRLLDAGVERHEIEGVSVAVTTPARTVADCFKHRSRVGIDTATAALRDYLRVHRTGRDALWEMAGVCRVQTVMRPYLEALS